MGTDPWEGRGQGEGWLGQLGKGWDEVRIIWVDTGSRHRSKVTGSVCQDGRMHGCLEVWSVSSFTPIITNIRDPGRCDVAQQAQMHSLLGADPQAWCCASAAQEVVWIVIDWVWLDHGKMGQDFDKPPCYSSKLCSSMCLRPHVIRYK